MNKKNIKKLIEKGGGKLKNIAIGDFVIPDSVTTIGDWAFRGCCDLHTIIIPNSVTSIGQSAFSRCTSLTSVTIPNSVTLIGNSAFDGCTSLTSITIPNSVSSIRLSAFEGCSSLTSVTIPNSVKSIGCYAFNDCSSLTSIAIPNSVTSIGIGAFWCENLTTIIIPCGSREKFKQLLPKELHHKMKEDIIGLSEGEVNYEQKYKEAIERARNEWIKNLDNCYKNYRERLEIIFPELKECEDERIKKEILNLVSIAGNGNQFEEIKNWLEKQGKNIADMGD